MIKKLTRKTILWISTGYVYAAIRRKDISCVLVSKDDNNVEHKSYTVMLCLGNGKEFTSGYTFNSHEEASAYAQYVGRLIK